MNQFVKKLRPIRKRATEIRHSRYPDIWMLLSVANQPVSMPMGGNPESSIVGFRFKAENDRDEISFPGLSIDEVCQAMESSPHVASYTRHTPEILFIQPNGLHAMRRTQIMADLTQGPRILIEILPETAIDEAVITATRIIARALPQFGFRYMVVFPCQFKKTAWSHL